MNKEDEYHTVVISYLGDGKGKTETSYYGEAKAPNQQINDYSQLRLTKGASLEEIFADFTWRARSKKFIKNVLMISR